MNKKGYMLVEIIVASFIAFGIAYFILNMTIKLKNKNDDLLVETQVRTDQTIIMNKLIKYAQVEKEAFNCDLLMVDGNTVKYKDEVIDIINNYVIVGEKKCSNQDGQIKVSIPLEVKQVSNKDFSIAVDYKYMMAITEVEVIGYPEKAIKIDGVLYNLDAQGKVKLKLPVGRHTFEDQYVTSNSKTFDVTSSTTQFVLGYKTNIDSFSTPYFSGYVSTGTEKKSASSSVSVDLPPGSYTHIKVKAAVTSEQKRSDDSTCASPLPQGTTTLSVSVSGAINASFGSTSATNGGKTDNGVCTITLPRSKSSSLSKNLAISTLNGGTLTFTASVSSSESAGNTYVQLRGTGKVSEIYIY